jgi:hypothetical protein
MRRNIMQISCGLPSRSWLSECVQCRQTRGRSAWGDWGNVSMLPPWLFGGKKARDRQRNLRGTEGSLRFHLLKYFGEVRCMAMPSRCSIASAPCKGTPLRFHTLTV